LNLFGLPFVGVEALGVEWMFVIAEAELESRTLDFSAAAAPIAAEAKLLLVEVALVAQMTD
jgi:hypothetical protein